MPVPPTYTLFQGQRRLLTAPLPEVLTFLKGGFRRDPTLPLLIFDDQTGRTTDLDLRGTLREVLDRHAPAPARTGPGRPKLGVVSREVSLLPRHWDWLESHPNGASATLRRLVDEARRADPAAERRRLAAQSADRFLTVLGGDLPGAEEASRALYRGDGTAFGRVVQAWPEDLRLHALHLAAPAFQEDADDT